MLFLAILIFSHPNEDSPSTDKYIHKNEGKTMDGYTVTVIFEVNADKVDQMKAIVADVYLPSIRESGMREYRWYRSRQIPNHFLLFMTWDTKEAFKAHVNTSHVKKGEADFVSKGILIKNPREIDWQYIKL